MEETDLVLCEERLCVPKLCASLFAGEFRVKAAQSDREGLNCIQWITVIQREVVLLNATKLHDYIFRIDFIYKLEVLHGSLIHTAVEV